MSLHKGKRISVLFVIIFFQHSCQFEILSNKVFVWNICSKFKNDWFLNIHAVLKQLQNI